MTTEYYTTENAQDCLRQDIAFDNKLLWKASEELGKPARIREDVQRIGV
jgi:hypothetical protein